VLVGILIQRSHEGRGGLFLYHRWQLS
jgi:hypothetical protein